MDLRLLWRTCSQNWWLKDDKHTAFASKVSPAEFKWLMDSLHWTCNFPLKKYFLKTSAGYLVFMRESKGNYKQGCYGYHSLRGFCRYCGTEIPQLCFLACDKWRPGWRWGRSEGSPCNDKLALLLLLWTFYFFSSHLQHLSCAWHGYPWPLIMCISVYFGEILGVQLQQGGSFLLRARVMKTAFYGCICKSLVIHWSKWFLVADTA